MPDYTPGQRLRLPDGRTATVGADGVPRFDPPQSAPPAVTPGDGVLYGRPKPEARPQVAPPGLADAVAPGGPGILGPNGSYTAPRAAPEVDPKDAARAAKQEEDMRRAAGVLRDTIGHARRRLDGSVDRLNLGVWKGEWDNSLLGVRGFLERRIPGTPAAVFDGQLDTIRGNTAIAKLLEMKSHSSTGASGFGALTAPELALLTSALGSLDLNKNDYETMSRTLRQIDELTARAFPDEAAPAPASAPQTANPALPPSSTYTVPLSQTGKTPAQLTAEGFVRGPDGIWRKGGARPGADRPGPPRRDPARAAPAKPLDQMSQEELERIARGG